MQETELVILIHQRKKLGSEVNIKLNRKRIYPTGFVKYLRIKIDKNFNWKHHVSDITIVLTRANSLLFKIRNFVNVNTLKTIMQSLTHILIMQM